MSRASVCPGRAVLKRLLDGSLGRHALFMAPEQARSEALDHRADLFSLGAVLYAMCTGRSPFRASTTLGVLRRVCDDTPRPVREVNPDVPEWLAAIIDPLLSKDRADRCQTAAEVVDVLGTHLARRQRGNGESKCVDPALIASQKRLERLHQEYNDRCRTISEEILQRMQSE